MRHVSVCCLSPSPIDSSNFTIIGENAPTVIKRGCATADDGRVRELSCTPAFEPTIFAPLLAGLAYLVGLHAYESQQLQSLENFYKLDTPFGVLADAASLF